MGCIHNVCLIKIRSKHRSITYTTEFATIFYETDVTYHCNNRNKRIMNGVGNYFYSSNERKKDTK